MPTPMGAGAVPDFGTSVVRRSALERIASSARAAVILCAPSGYGKSVTASQYCRSVALQSAPVWVDCYGQSPSVLGLADALLVAMRRHPLSTNPKSDQDGLLEIAAALSESQPGVVVLDDVRLEDREFVEALGELAQLVARVGGKLLVTSRAAPMSSVGGLDCTLLDEEDLRLSLEECSALAESMALDGPADESLERLWEECGGQPAMATLLLRQAASVPHASPRRGVRQELERLLQRELNMSERAVLTRVALVGSGTAEDLRLLGVDFPIGVLEELGRKVPLVRVSSSASRVGTTFRVHDILIEHLRSEACTALASEEYRALIDLLTNSGRPEQAARALLARPDEGFSATWLASNGEELVRGGALDLAEALFEQLDSTVLISSPALLILQARILTHRRDIEAALARVVAACSIAKYENDNSALAEALHTRTQLSIELGDLDGALDGASELFSLAAEDVPARLRVSAMMAMAACRLYRAEPADAIGLLSEAAGLARESGCDDLLRVALSNSAVAQIWANGDYAAAAVLLSQLSADPSLSAIDRIRTQGNLGGCHCHTGRLERARLTLESCVSECSEIGLADRVGLYRSILGAVQVSEGKTDRGLENMQAAVEQCLVAGDRVSAEQCRLYLATVLRAQGCNYEALSASEQCFEAMGVAGNAFERGLAVLELASSFLSLGDASRAARMVTVDKHENPSTNSHHLLRADMILAEIARREGRLDDAVALIAGHEDYILTESSNWQIAMYCRAFPELLGVFALAIEPDRLPVHMLRMILPDNAERSLIGSRGWVDDATWRQLGVRLLGEEEFESFIERDGRPLCRVRLFGGLEVSVGGRAVTERDWKKRKARLLFAMLVARRGQEVPRDQVLEYLWPEMDESRARNNLYVVWSAMKGALLGDTDKSAHLPYIENSRGMCRINVEAVRSDVEEFERRLADAAAALEAGDQVAALAAYRELGELYRGELLPGDIYDDWFSDQRERYKTEFVAAMRKAAEICADRKELGAALHYVRRAVQADPWQEDLYQLALRCQIAAGQRGAAIETYMQCRTKLSEDLGLDPSSETRALYDQILAMEDRPMPMDYFEALD